MTESRNASSSPISRLIVALILLAVNVALIAPSPQNDITVDEAVGTAIVLQKKIYDDPTKSDTSYKVFDSDPSFDAVVATIVFVLVALGLALCTTRHLAAIHLVAYVVSPPRAPPPYFPG